MIRPGVPARADRASRPSSTPHAGRELSGGTGTALLPEGSPDVFRTDDVDATFQRVRATGARGLQDPMDDHYGVRGCSFRIPSGDLVRVQWPGSPGKRDAGVAGQPVDAFCRLPVMTNPS